MSNNPSSKTVIIPARVPNELARQLDEFVSAGLAESRTALVRQALELGLAEIERQALAAAPGNLPAFAAQVLEAARQTPMSLRFGEDRLLIHRAWRAWMVHTGSELELDAFKARLVEANRERLLSLVRADMAPVMDRPSVEAAATPHPGGVFHLLCL